MKRRIMTHELSHISHHKTRITKDKQPHLEKKVVREDARKIKQPLGNECCSRKCLQDIKYSDAKEFYDRFHVDRLVKLGKIQEYLKDCLVLTKTLSSNSIGGSQFELKFLGRYICPSALRSLLHIGMTTLEKLALFDEPLPAVHVHSKPVKETKSDLCRNWFRETVLTKCVIDDEEPTFFRCDEFASEAAVERAYKDYLIETFKEIGDGRATCSHSTFVTVLYEFGNILFGESAACYECCTMRKEIRICKMKLKTLEKSGSLEIAKIEELRSKLNRWNESKRLHKVKADELQSLSNISLYVWLF
jgi:hypothetical protein